jgi:hypothetical protein
VKLAPNNTRFAGVNSLEGIKFTAGEMYGGSIMNPAPVLCAFPNTYDGKANSWILAARDSSNPPPTGTTYFKMVEVMLEETPPKAGVRCPSLNKIFHSNRAIGSYDFWLEASILCDSMTCICSLKECYWILRFLA